MACLIAVGSYIRASHDLCLAWFCVSFAKRQVIRDTLSRSVIGPPADFSTAVLLSVVTEAASRILNGEPKVRIVQEDALATACLRILPAEIQALDPNNHHDEDGASMDS